jgi:hypothetical protein
LRCDERFTHAFTACGCDFKEITLVGSNQGNYFENENACSKRKLKTTVATQLYTPFFTENPPKKGGKKEAAADFSAEFHPDSVKVCQARHAS